ncbi:lactonase family protein [Algoriphagus aquimarinus]|uniref:lactonase family protein n=1 Tax=Algoriphagus aquimarinus TaxID=237018 RepID=UPI0030D94038|tara:strand:+ start:71486 stop:72625 length:1140 start_codon:yes stop_codon:yes gene_type:complete
MKQSLLVTVFLAIFFACTTDKTTKMTENPITYSFLVGTYTDDASQGINQLDFTPSENKLEVRTIFPGIQNPSFVIANSVGDKVFTLEEIDNVPGGNIISLSRTSEDQALSKLSELPSFGDHPCYIALSPNEQFLTVANYSGGSFSAYKIGENANLSHLQTIQHEGSSINQARQSSPHVHSTVFSPDGKFLLVADLGTDQVYVYNFNQDEAKPLTLNNIHKVTPGDGPRHLIFSKDGKEIMLVEEMSASLDILSFDAGKISPKQKISLVTEGFDGGVGAAEVRLSPDEKNIYVSNRGDANTISVISKKASGEYEFIQQILSGGIMPRNFNLTADGKYLLAAHQASDDVIIFERDLETGVLSQTDWKVSVHSPVYLFRLGD